MKKSLLYSGYIGVFLIGIFFLQTPIFQVAEANTLKPQITEIINSENLDTIALALYATHDKNMYREAFQKHGNLKLKADITPTYAKALKSKILSSKIHSKNLNFQAYIYILGRLSESPQINAHEHDTLTLDLLGLAETGNLNESDVLLENTEMAQIFTRLGYLPWRSIDLKIMRRVIIRENLSAETKYTKAYLTAQMLFGKKSLGNRIGIKKGFQHKKQISGLSCEANSTAHLYNYYANSTGTSKVTEDQVFQWFPLDERPPEYQRTKAGYLRTWGDPEKTFVGKVNGIQSIDQNQLSGYGIHAHGVMPVLHKQLLPLGYAPKLQNFNEMNIVLSVKTNHPVLFWYVLSSDMNKKATQLNWKTWDGENRTGYVGEHTGVIVGVELTKNGTLSKVAYYEGRSEEMIWEDWETLKTKAKLFDSIIVAVEK